MNRVKGMARSATPLVSVIIATHNRAHVISQAIESVLSQTFEDYEIIVVDDGSSDGTAGLLRERYAEKVVYISKETNAGLSAARNTGIQAARGRYVAILDDDDLWLPEKLEMQIGLMEEKPSLGLVYCNSFTVNEHDEVLGEIKGTQKGAIFDEVLSSNCLGPPSGILLQKKVFAETGYFDENLTALEDWDLWIRVSQCYEIDFVDQPLVRYRVHSDNMSRDIVNMQRSTFAVLDKYWPPICSDKAHEEKRSRVYSNHYVNFAWKQYRAANREAFRELVMKALESDPLHTVVLKGDNLPEKEKALFHVFHDFWEQRNSRADRVMKQQSFTTHYMQLAWEYYHHGDMSNFRRCVRRVFHVTFPRLPVRLALPFIKSFLGKRLADKVHDVRKVIQKILSQNAPTDARRQGMRKTVSTVVKRGISFFTRRKNIRRYLEGHRVRKLHIGCGGMILKNWLNTDLDPSDNQLFIDARKKLPFDDSTFDYLFSEHLIEHLEYPEGVDFFLECFRIIKPCGVIRIATPDLRFLIELYNAEKNELQEHYIAWAIHSFLPDVGVPQDTQVINNFFRNWGHKFIYDFKTLQATMQRAGFINITPCTVGESDDAELRGIESHGKVIPEMFNRLETMVVEAIKPDCGL